MKSLYLSLYKLNDHGIITELWPYLTIKDICQLLVLNKTIRIVALYNNKLFSKEINLKMENSFKEKRNNKKLKNIIFSFPNISKINITYQEHKKICHINDFIAPSHLTILYHSDSVCMSLKELTVKLNNKGSIGISNLKNLILLDIHSSPMFDNAMIEISTMMTITSLNISNCFFLSIEVLHQILKMTNLKSLDMTKCKWLSNDGLSQLSDNLTNLTYLNLSSIVNIEDSGAIHLSKLVKLTSLYLLGFARITTLSYLSALNNITFLDLSYCLHITDEGFSTICLLTNIRSLNISNTFLKEDGLLHLNSLCRIENLNITNCLKFTNIALGYISSLTSLKVLTMNLEREMTNEGIVHLCKLDLIAIIIENLFFEKIVFSEEVMLMFVNLNLFEIHNLHFPLDEGSLHKNRLTKNQHYLAGLGDSFIKIDFQDVLILRKLKNEKK